MTTRLTLTLCPGGNHVKVRTEDGYAFDMDVADLLLERPTGRTRPETRSESLVAYIKAEIVRVRAMTFADAKTVIESRDFEKPR